MRGTSMKKTQAALRFKAFLSIVLFLLGLAGIACYFLIRYNLFGIAAGMEEDLATTLSRVSLEIGALCAVLGFVAIIVCAVKLSKVEKQIKAEEKAAADAKNAETAAEADARAVQPIEQLTASDYGPIMYVPTMEAPQVVVIGDKQPIDEKFAQIARMDKTQFVVYVARLFSRKGYAVKLTPVADNYCIDMLVEKQGTITAVSVVQSTGLLGKNDVACVCEGRRHYPANNAMVLTNSYYDSSAVDYAREHGLALVDHNVLASQYMA